MDSNDSNHPGNKNERPSRREFLTRVGFMAGGMALFGLPNFRSSGAQAALQSSMTGAHSMLELEGEVIPVKSVDGGFPKADVILDPPNSVPPFVKKHVGPPRSQEVVMECFPIMPKQLLEWVTNTLNMNFIRKNGAVITTDFNYVEQSRLQFNNAVITEIGFPACEGASKDPGFLTLKFAPEFTTPLAGKGTVTTPKSTQKIWPKSNYRLAIPGLDCTQVSKIEAFTVKQKFAPEAIGLARDFVKQPGTLEFPNLALTLSESSAGTFYAWFQDMVLRGKAGEESEKIGTLELLDPTLTTTLLTITFNHLGIFAFGPEKVAAGTDTIRRVKVEMYCEQITIAPGKG